MEDHMITPAAHQSQDEHMTTEKQMEGKKNYIYYYKISQMTGNKRDHKIGTSWERGLTAPPPNIHMWPLWKVERLLSLLMQPRTFYCSLKADILNFIH